MSLVNFNPPVAPKYHVTFHANRGLEGPGNPMVTGADLCWSFPEAESIARIRVTFGGIPSQSYVWEGDTCLLKFWRDFDGNLWVEKNPKEASR